MSYDDIRTIGSVTEDGATLLDDTHAFLSRLVVCSDAALVAGTLWAVHTHAFDAAESTPRLSIRSAEAESGKTRYLEALELIVRRPELAVNISDASLFRLVESECPTILHDEIDSVFGPKAREREDLRGLLNAGYRRGATVPRCVGEGTKMTVKRFQVFAPVAFAGIGKLPHTLETRSIIVRMKPRTVGEKVDRLRLRKIRPEAEKMRSRLAAWAETQIPTLTDAEPDLPRDLSDRAQDIWEPLIALADLAGGAWPERARAAASELFAARGEDEESIGRRLLADIRTVFDDPERDDPVDDEKGQAIASGALAFSLAAIEGAPWAEWSRDDKPISANKVARMLRAYDIKPDQHKIAGRNLRGYLRSDFEDAWLRHLDPPPPVESVTGPNVLPANPNKGKGGNTFTPVTHSGEGEADRAAPSTLAEVAQWERDRLAEIDPDDPDHGYEVARVRGEAARARIAIKGRPPG